MKQLNITTANRVLKFYQKLENEDQVILTNDNNLPLIIEHLGIVKTDSVEGTLFGIGEILNLKDRQFKRYMQFLLIKNEPNTTEKSPITIIPCLLNENSGEVSEIGCVIENNTIVSENVPIQLALTKETSTWIQALVKSNYLKPKKSSK